MLLIRKRETRERRENSGKIEKRINIKRESHLNKKVRIHPNSKVNLVALFVLVPIDSVIAPNEIGCLLLLLSVQVMMVVLMRTHQE